MLLPANRFDNALSPARSDARCGHLDKVDERWCGFDVGSEHVPQHPSLNRFAPPATTGYVSVLELGDGKTKNRMVEVEYGDEVGQMRLVPLPDGRVVLVTGDDAEFFEV